MAKFLTGTDRGTGGLRVDEAAGGLITTADALLGSITTNTADGTDGTHAGITKGGTGWATSGSGIDAVFTVIVSSNEVTSITATTAGSGFGIGDTITFSTTSAIGGTTAVVFTLQGGDTDIEDVYGVNHISVSESTLTDNGGGHVTITTGGGGGGGITMTNGVNNRVTTATSATNIDGEEHLTFDGATLAVTGDITVTTSVAATTTVTAGTTISALDTVTGGQGLIATTGGVTATAGGVTATAGNIVADVGNITATAGNIVATAGDITATTGDIVAAGVGGTVTGTNGVTATTGNVTATAGNVIAGDTVQGVTITDTLAKIVAGTVSNMAFGYLEQVLTTPGVPEAISDPTARFVVLTSADPTMILDLAATTPAAVVGTFVIIYAATAPGGTTIIDTSGTLNQPMAERQTMLFVRGPAGFFVMGAFA